MIVHGTKTPCITAFSIITSSSIHCIITSFSYATGHRCIYSCKGHILDSLYFTANKHAVVSRQVILKAQASLVNAFCMLDRELHVHEVELCDYISGTSALSPG